MPLRFVQHCSRWVNPNDIGIELFGERLGEPSGAAAHIKDRLHVFALDVRGNNIHPLLQHLRLQAASGPVGFCHFCLVVIHCG